jgi:hypothetical protein
VNQWKISGALCVTALGVGLIAVPAMADSSSAQSALQGLLNGNQNQDTAVRNAYERGYQNGRQDEARLNGSGRGATRSNSDQPYGNRDYPGSNGGYRPSDSYSR